MYSRDIRCPELGDIQLIDYAARLAGIALEEVNLVDVEAVRFLNHCQAEGIRMMNHSPYIREWMRRERAQSI